MLVAADLACSRESLVRAGRTYCFFLLSELKCMVLSNLVSTAVGQLAGQFDGKMRGPLFNGALSARGIVPTPQHLAACCHPRSLAFRGCHLVSVNNAVTSRCCNRDTIDAWKNISGVGDGTAA